MMEEDNDSVPPTPSYLYITRLIPHEETVSWKVHDVSTLLKTQAWTSMSIPLQVGVGAAELSSWNISLQARNNNSVLCARTMLISPQEQHRRITHHLKVAVIMEGGAEQGPVYYFPAAPASATNNDSNNPTNSNNPNNTATNANLTVTTNNTNNRNRGGGGGGGGNNNDNGARCSSMRRALRRFFVKNAKLDGGEDELIGDGRLTKEARPAHKAPLSLWKIVPIDKIRPGEDDCIELRVTLTVFGCDVEEKRI